MGIYSDSKPDIICGAFVAASRSMDDGRLDVLVVPSISSDTKVRANIL
jgi:hypothetical protein